MSGLRGLNPATLVVAAVVSGMLLAAPSVRAQEVTVLRGSPPSRSAAEVDCNNPSYAQYCQGPGTPQNQYYEPYNYDDAYPYYGSTLSPGAVPRFRFLHRRSNFHKSFHGGGFHTGGFGGGRFHGDGGHH